MITSLERRISRLEDLLLKKEEPDEENDIKKAIAEREKGVRVPYPV